MIGQEGSGASGGYVTMRLQREMVLLKSIKSTARNGLKVLVLLLDDVVIIALIFLVARELEIKIPLPVIILTGLLLAGANFAVYKAVMPTFHKKPLTGAEGLIGATGNVVTELTPVGTIRIEGELWKARSAGKNIAADEEVEVLKLHGLTLTVRDKTR